MKVFSFLITIVFIGTVSAHAGEKKKNEKRTPANDGGAQLVFLNGKANNQHLSTMNIVGWGSGAGGQGLLISASNSGGREVGCFIRKSLAEKNGFSMGELYIILSQPNVKVNCVTDSDSRTEAEATSFSISVFSSSIDSYRN